MIEAALRNWKLVLGGAIVAGLCIALAIVMGDARHWEKRWEGERDAHAQTEANYRAAAKQAEIDALKNKVRVEKDQAVITERVAHDYQDRLADADARYERLRAQAAAYSRSPAGTDLSDTREATCRAFAGTPCEDIPPLLREAQRNTDQLLALQAWVRAQTGVDFGNGAPPD